MRDISLEMVEALFAEEVEPIAALVTITAAGLDDPIRVCSAPEGMGQNNPGLESRGNSYIFFPFQVAWAGASSTEPVRQTQIVIGDGADARIANAIRTVTGQPTVTVEVVRISAPDVVEMAITDAVLGEASIEGPKVTGTLKPREFDSEPACAARYTIARTPSIF